MFGGILLMSFMIPYIGVIFYFLIGIGSGLFNVLVDHFLQKHIVSSHRATISSINNMASQLGLTIMFPVVGFVSKAKSMGTSLRLLGIVLVVYSLGLYFYSRNISLHHKKRKR